MRLKLYNTLTRKKEIFKPLHKKFVGLYTCGPTVYNYAHIGNLRTYICQDILQKTLEYNGYKVKRVMNITDVGHLTSDDLIKAEDKIEKEAIKEKKTVWQIIKFYTRAFLQDLKKLNIQRPLILIPATKTIKDQIKLIQKLLDNGFAYETSQALYFDISKLKHYNKLSPQSLSKKIIAARKEVIIDKEKRNPADFVLWFKLVGRFKNHIMRWSSPWGLGFPGWHIECSAIAIKYLKQPFDIHSGGIDLISPHHENEIAQAEAANNKPFAKYWIHIEHLLVNNKKMAKSLKNFYTLKDLENRNINPIAFRYLVLNSHYRSKLNFSWQSLESAKNSLNNLYKEFIKIKKNKNSKQKIQKSDFKNYHKLFKEALNNDLNTPKAISVVWQIIKDKKLNNSTKYLLLSNFDKVLKLNLTKIKLTKLKIPQDIKKLIKLREKLRQQKKWSEADKIRKKIENFGFIIEDTPTGPKIKSKTI